MSARQDHAIPVRPRWIGRVVLGVARPKRVGQWREGHRRSRMSGFRGLDGVHRHGADGVDAQRVEALVGHGGWSCDVGKGAQSESALRHRLRRKLAVRRDGRTYSGIVSTQ